MQIFNQNNTWTRIPNAILKDKSLSSNEKLIYTLMLSKYTFFKKRGGTYFESMQSIADELGLTRQTVGTCVKKLEIKLLVESKKKANPNGYTGYEYSVVDRFKVFSPEAKESEVHPETDSLLG